MSARHPKVKELAEQVAKDSIVTQALSRFIEQVMEVMVEDEIKPLQARIEALEGRMEMTDQEKTELLALADSIEQGHARVVHLNEDTQWAPYKTDVVVEALRRSTAARDMMRDRYGHNHNGTSEPRWSRLTYLAHAKGYVMARRPGCAPFILTTKQWFDFPLWEKEKAPT